MISPRNRTDFDIFGLGLAACNDVFLAQVHQFGDRESQARIASRAPHGLCRLKKRVAILSIEVTHMEKLGVDRNGMKINENL